MYETVAVHDRSSSTPVYRLNLFAVLFGDIIKNKQSRPRSARGKNAICRRSPGRTDRQTDRDVWSAR